MDEVARQARNEYRRAWAKANRDKVKAQQARYWTRQAEKLAAKKEATEHVTDERDICAAFGERSEEDATQNEDL